MPLLPGCAILGWCRNYYSEPSMLRFTIAILLAILASGPAMSAERAVTRHGVHRTAVMLPAGLPRPHYKFRTTISYSPPHSYQKTYVRPFYGYEPEALFTPAYAEVSYLSFSPWISTPLLPGYSTLPGYFMSGLIPTLTRTPTTVPMSIIGNACLTPAAFTAIARDFTASRCASPPCFRARAGCCAEALNR